MLETQLRSFLQAEGASRRWLSGSEIAVYVRKGLRVSENGICESLDIANIEIDIPEKDGLTEFIKTAEKTIPHGNMIYVEGVTDQAFGDFFERRGYESIPNTNPPSFVWHKKQ